MLFLCLAILSSSGISLLMRVSSNKVNAKLSMLGVNYLICTLLAAAYAGFQLFPAPMEGLSRTMALGVVNGFLFLGGFMLFQRNTRCHGMALTSVFMKLGLLVPIVLSVVVFRDRPTEPQILGFCIALLAIILINAKKEQGEKRLGWQLPLMLLMCGGADAMSKVFEVLGPGELSEHFLFYTFAMALLLCGGLVVFKKEKPGIKELLYGAAIGVPNFFASKFLLLSLDHLPAVVVFPSFSIGTMLFASLAGVVFYKERLTKLQWVSLVAILVALLLLNI